MKKEIVERSSNSILKMDGIYCKGYGLISKLFMQDERLSIEAKCIYSYLCSYAGAGTVAFPSVSLQVKHLNISEKRYRKHRQQLIDFGYITVEQSREDVVYDDGTGKQIYANNVYTIVTDLSLIDTGDLTVPKKVKPKKKAKAKKAKSVENTGVEDDSTSTEKVQAVEGEDVHFESGRFDRAHFDRTQNDRTNINSNNNNSNNINKEYSKDKIENDNINNSNSELSSSERLGIDKKEDLGETIIPDNMDIDRAIITLLKKDRDFKGLNFDQGDFYCAFLESVVATQLQDGVEVLSIQQWRYFKKVLSNKIAPLVLELQLLGER